MRKILLLLKTTMAVPQPLGAFHIVALLLTLLLDFIHIVAGYLAYFRAGRPADIPITE